MNGLAFLLLLGCCIPVFIRGEPLSSSACYGTNPECDYYTLNCSSANDVIRLQDMYVGHKQQDVCMPATHCNNSDTCCTKASDDVIGRFNLKNTFDAYANCSGKHVCANVQAPWQQFDVSSLTSTYVHMEYTCTPENDILNFCGSTTDTSSVSKTGKVVDIKFDSRKQNTSAAYNKSCRCHVASEDGAGLNASLTLVDVRMHSYVSKGNESQQYECSSSIFSSNTLAVSCVNSTNHHDDNFRYNETVVWELTTESIFTLDDLYLDGRLDAPAMVWLSIQATDGDRDVSVTCNEVYPDVTTSTNIPSSTAPSTSTDHVTTSTMRTTPVTSPTSDTTPFSDARTGDDEEEDNTVLYLAIFVPLGFLLLLVCLFILIARYRKHKRLKRLKYLSQGNGYFRDAYVLDKFIIDITNQDAEPINTWKDPNDRVHSNPVYVADDMTPTRSRITSTSDTIPTPGLSSNSLSTMLKNSPFSNEQRLSNTARISINTDAGETNARESLNDKHLQGKVTDETVRNRDVVQSKTKDSLEQQTSKSNNLARGSVIMNDDSGTTIRVNNSALPQTGTGTNPPDIHGNNHPPMANKTKLSPENNDNSLQKDKGKSETPGTNAVKLSPGNKKDIAQTEPTTAKSAGKRHEILTSSDGGVIIRIGAAPVSHERRKTPSNTPAIIVPETIEDRRSATAHILPAHANEANTSVLFISNPAKK